MDIFSPRTFNGKILHELFLLKNYHLIHYLKPDLPNLYDIKTLIRRLFPMLIKIVDYKAIIKSILRIINKEDTNKGDSNEFNE
ncbi:MAG: hypothetical protein Q6351_003140 [Candidatus Njordarchaeum guaymaensis]